MTLQEVLQQIINKHYGKQDAGDTPQNMGQCVGLIEEYTDSLNLPHTWGNAKDLLADADPNFFEIVKNDPTDPNQYPPVGAIFVYDETWGQGDGHTGLVAISSGIAFVGFEQNNPNVCDFVVHNYIHLKGWLIPKVDSATTAQPTTQTPEITDQTKIDMGDGFGVMEVGAIRSQLHDNFRNLGSASLEVKDLTQKLEESQNTVKDLQDQLNTCTTSLKNTPKSGSNPTPLTSYQFASWVPTWLRELVSG